MTDGVRVAVYRILRNQSWMCSPVCGGDVGVEQDADADPDALACLARYITLLYFLALPNNG